MIGFQAKRILVANTRLRGRKGAITTEVTPVSGYFILGHFFIKAEKGFNMPNWAEGVLKVRGTKEKILNFLKKGIAYFSYSLELKNGEITRDDAITFDDFKWEAPDNRMGG